jgi:hypothetical protein
MDRQELNETLDLSFGCDISEVEEQDLVAIAGTIEEYLRIKNT